jgi:serine protease Do
MKMLKVNWMGMHRWVLAMATGGMLGFVVVAPAAAQTRVLPDFTELVEQVGPSVVNIRTLEKVAARPRGGNGNGIDEDMLEFFRRFGVPIPNMPRQQPGPRSNRPQEEEQPRGVGSGFILTADGYIMTNAHVVDGADEVLVTLTDDREFKARIVGADKRTDVAVVKIEATGLPAVKVGDVNRLKVGEWVMAIGSPFGLKNTGQLRRAPDQHAWRGGRHQQPDLLALGRVHGHLVRYSDGRGDPGQ